MRDLFRDDREHGTPLDLAEIVFLNGKGTHGLKKWFRGNYVKKVIKEIGDHPYNGCKQTNQGGDPHAFNNNIL